MQLSDLALGECAVIDSFTDLDMSVKLMEMGCLPGETVRVEQIAPMGCPIAVSVLGYKLSLRVKEASSICLKNREEA